MYVYAVHAYLYCILVRYMYYIQYVSSHFTIACIYGDPHIVTLDGHKYTFNGKGEFTMIQTEDDVFTLQGRMVEATNTSGSKVPATVFSALAAKAWNSDTIQVGFIQFGSLCMLTS